MDELNAAEIGARIRELRGKLTQQEFGDQLGVGRTSIVRYESGQRTPDAMFLASIHSTLGVDLIWLLTGQRSESSPASPLKPDEAALLDNYRNSPKVQQDILKATSAAFAQSKVRRKVD